MQISNNLTSPHFGSFKISPKAQKKLHTLTPQDLNLLRKAEEELAGITTRTLELTEDLEPRITDNGPDVFVKLFHPVKPKTNELNITTIWDGSPIINFRRKGQRFCLRVPFDSKEEALEAYKTMKEAKTPLGQAIETVKILDRQMAKIIRKD